MSKFTVGLIGVVAAVLAVIFVVNTFEFSPVQSVQRGFRGLAMEENITARAAAAKAVANRLPEPAPAVDKANRKASQEYKNLKVLGDMDANDFLRLMTDITTWVSPEQGCAYCHDENDLAADRPYTKIVSRRMLEMVRYINGSWKIHVADTGVTCWACHRGQPVPANTWSEPLPPRAFRTVGTRISQNKGSETAAFSSLPNETFGSFLKASEDLRVVPATRVLHSRDMASMQATEATYGFMMHVSQGLGVNCTYCHNSRSFVAWDQSTPQRATAWYGIRMTRALNNEFLEPLKPVFPENRLGPMGDVLKSNCATCHEGNAKPLNGVSMIKDYPILVGPAPARTAAAAPAKAK
ncbi:photosynthetic reaction center cytochrome PufC [Rhodoplanes azumiensis]|uniref:Photosynthetic reaction center cytochrome c subunit n=1 Tax=Rhodoplanes azumiensis TaxID=1897628 RepID=A0ABW5AHE8_9BRAD